MDETSSDRKRSVTKHDRIMINIGCGLSPTEGWLNFDNSPAIKIARSEFLFSIMKFMNLLNEKQISNINWNRENSIRFADATKKIPLADASVAVVYSSHMLEHLSLEAANVCLLEIKRVLKPGGKLRISVPDLRLMVEEYLRSGDANKFIKKSHLVAPPIKSLKEKIKVIAYGYRHHQWLYDEKSLKKCS